MLQLSFNTSQDQFYNFVSLSIFSNESADSVQFNFNTIEQVLFLLYYASLDLMLYFNFIDQTN